MSKTEGKGSGSGIQAEGVKARGKMRREEGERRKLNLFFYK